MLGGWEWWAGGCGAMMMTIFRLGLPGVASWLSCSQCDWPSLFKIECLTWLSEVHSTNRVSNVHQFTWTGWKAVRHSIPSFFIWDILTLTCKVQSTCRWGLLLRENFNHSEVWLCWKSPNFNMMLPLIIIKLQICQERILYFLSGA
jgi:hypothetical protein